MDEISNDPDGEPIAGGEQSLRTGYRSGSRTLAREREADDHLAIGLDGEILCYLPGRPIE